MNIGTEQSPQYIPHGKGTLRYTAEGIVAPYKNGWFHGEFSDGKPISGSAFSGMSGRNIGGSPPGDSIWGATATTRARLRDQNNSATTRRALTSRNSRPRQNYQQRPNSQNNRTNKNAELFYRHVEENNPSLRSWIPPEYRSSGFDGKL